VKTVLSFVLAAAAITLSAPASAQFAKPEDAIKYRKSALTVMAAHFGRLGAMATGKVPFDAKVAVENADVVVAMSKLPWAAFGPGTDTGDTKAKPEIWKDAAKFKAAQEKMQGEVVKLAAAAKTGNLDNLKSAFGPAAESCKACHDEFRAK
jgi:cytochrome c556